MSERAAGEQWHVYRYPDGERLYTASSYDECDGWRIVNGTPAFIAPTYPIAQWKVRRSRRKDGTLYTHTVVYDVWNPDGEWTGTFETWAEAMAWATTVTPHVEHWLSNQTKEA